MLLVVMDIEIFIYCCVCFVCLEKKYCFYYYEFNDEVLGWEIEELFFINYVDKEFMIMVMILKCLYLVFYFLK